MEPTRSDQILDEWSCRGPICHAARPAAARGDHRRRGRRDQPRGRRGPRRRARRGVRGAREPTQPERPGRPPDGLAVAVAVRCGRDPRSADTGTDHDPRANADADADRRAAPEVAACAGATLTARITSVGRRRGESDRQRRAHQPRVGTLHDDGRRAPQSRGRQRHGADRRGRRHPAAATVTIPRRRLGHDARRGRRTTAARPAVAPVGIAFDVNGIATVHRRRRRRTTDATVPPCNGPGQPGTIQMQPWSAS